MHIHVPCMHSFSFFTTVGSGSAGTVLAARLSENPDHRVLLVEAGESDRERKETPYIDIPALYPLLVNSSVDWGYYSVPQRHAGYAFNNRVMHIYVITRILILILLPWTIPGSLWLPWTSDTLNFKAAKIRHNGQHVM